MTIDVYPSFDGNREKLEKGTFISSEIEEEGYLMSPRRRNMLPSIIPVGRDNIYSSNGAREDSLNSNIVAASGNADTASELNSKATGLNAINNALESTEGTFGNRGDSGISIIQVTKRHILGQKRSDPALRSDLIDIFCAKIDPFWPLLDSTEPLTPFFLNAIYCSAERTQTKPNAPILGSLFYQNAQQTLPQISSYNAVLGLYLLSVYSAAVRPL